MTDIYEEKIWTRRYPKNYPLNIEIPSLRPSTFLNEAQERTRKIPPSIISMKPFPMRA